MNPIGIMQGRLSPPVNGRIQAFPLTTWRQEFLRARAAGLACLEWVYEQDAEAQNPLGTQDGIAEMRALSQQGGVMVWSICADYYMTRRLVASTGLPDRAVVDHLRWLIGQAGSLGAHYLVLPFVDASSLASPQEIEGLVAVLRAVLPIAERVGMALHLETDLAPTDVVSVMGHIAHPLVQMNYDIGNSAALGRDPRDELGAIRAWLGSVHVKDRRLGGATVPLGAGAADFQMCFRIICESGYHGPWILQAARESGLSEVELAIRNRQFVEEHLTAAAGRVS